MRTISFCGVVEPQGRISTSGHHLPREDEGSVLISKGKLGTIII